MPHSVLFSARPDMWVKFERPLLDAFAACDLEVDLTNHTDAPETVDFIIYAPANVDEDLSGFTSVKLIQSLWAGPDQLLRNPTLTQPLARMADTGMADGMSEYVLGHILRYHLHTDLLEQAPKGSWRSDLSPPLARDRTVAFLGVGALGQAAAKAAQAVGFRCLGWSRTQKEGLSLPCFAGPEGLAEVLGQADIVVTLMPATPQTAGIVNADTIALMKPGAALINPGRGVLIEDAALIAALRSGHLRGATLDVFQTEPLPADHAYWDMPQVFITPHIAAETRVQTAADFAARNIARVARGEPAQYLVDRALHY